MENAPKTLAEQLAEESKTIADRLAKESQEKTSQIVDQIRENTRPENVRKHLRPWIVRGEFEARFPLRDFKAAFLAFVFDYSTEIPWEGQKLLSTHVAIRLLERQGFHVSLIGTDSGEPDIRIGWHLDQKMRER